MLSSNQDAQGHEIYDYYKGDSDVLEVIERDDGLVDAYAGPRAYLSQYQDWPRHEKAAIPYARGRVLDTGCGGGRHSLYLQKKGFEVLGVDISPLAVRVCKLKGLRNVRLMSITQLGPKLGKFDTILMLGNNFGLFGNFQRARIMLRKFLKITNPQGEDNSKVWTFTSPQWNLFTGNITN